MWESLHPIITAAATAIGTTYLTNGEHGPIQTISDLWYFKFGNLHENIKDEKYSREIKRQNTYLSKTAKLAAEEIAKIPENNLQEPRENIAKPAISAIHDYNSEEELRKMFSKLLASSMDSSKNGIAHQAFVEIIKNLSPLDAQNLKILSIYKTFPLCEIQLHLTSGGYRTHFENLFLENPNVEDLHMQASSITNLNRLGLIDISYSKNLSSKERYQKYYDSHIFKGIQNYVLDLKKSTSEFEEAKIQEGIGTITPFGINFSSICL